MSSLSDRVLSLFQRDVCLFLSTQITLIIIARCLGAEIMGVWAILLLIPGYAEAFGRIKMEVAAVYFIGANKERLEDVATILFVSALSVSFILVLFCWLFSGTIYTLFFGKVQFDAMSLFLAMTLIIPLRLLFINFSYIFISKEEFRNYNIMVILQAVTSALVSIALILGFHLGIWGAVLGNIVGVITGLSFAARTFFQTERVSFKLNLPLAKKMLKFSVNDYLSGLMSYLQLNQMLLLAAFFLAPAELGFFSIAKSMCEVANRMLPVAASTVLLPRIAKLEGSSDSGMMVSRTFRITMFLLSIFSILLAITIKPIVVLLFGSAYTDVVEPFRIILPSVLLVQSGIVFTSYFSGKGRPDIMPKVLILPVLVQSILAFVLLPRFQLTGAAWGLFLSLATSFIIQTATFLHISGQKVRDLMITKEDVKYIVLFSTSKLKNYSKLCLPSSYRKQT